MTDQKERKQARMWMLGGADLLTALKRLYLFHTKGDIEGYVGWDSDLVSFEEIRAFSQSEEFLSHLDELKGVAESVKQDALNKQQSTKVRKPAPTKTKKTK